MHDQREQIFRLLEQAVMDRVFPGCVALVGRGDSILYHEAHGELANYSTKEGESAVGVNVAVDRQTHYDLASLTKVLGTTTLVALDLASGKLRLEDPLPNSLRKACPSATLADLLEHCAGLRAHEEFFREILGPPTVDSRAELLRILLSRTPPMESRITALYSDLGFILLGAWLEQLHGERLDALFERKISGPLGLGTGLLPALAYRPIEGEMIGLSTLVETRIAPTEVYDKQLYANQQLPSWFATRTTAEQSYSMAHGQVHDDNAFMMQGVAGHAGLFGDAQGVWELAQAWVRNRLPGLSAPIRERLLRRSTVTGSTRRMGWDAPSGKPDDIAGGCFSSRAFGHLGFSGVSLWIDPMDDDVPLIAILLSNRVHPTRGDSQAIKNIRRSFHQFSLGL